MYVRNTLIYLSIYYGTIALLIDVEYGEAIDYMIEDCFDTNMGPMLRFENKAARLGEH